MINLLTFTTLYPNAQQPTHGIFVENRLRFLLASGKARSSVVAPVGYFPFLHPTFGRYAKLAAIPPVEYRHGIQVDHPRYPIIPKIGMNLAPRFLYWAARRHLARMIEAGETFDLIDAHYFYPDGAVAAKLAQDFQLPLIITARGSDLTLLPTYTYARRKIVWAARATDHVVAVSPSLKDKLVGLGIDGGRITVLRNGVDLNMFRQLDCEEARKRFSVRGPTIVSVGHLIDRKGHDLVITALQDLPDARLLIAGEGPLRRELEALAHRFSLGDRVRFLGPLPYEDMPWLFNAADLTVLASSREGWANVLLESLACGTPIVATNVGSAAEVLQNSTVGLVVKERTVSALTAAMAAQLAKPKARDEIRVYAEKFSWDETTKGQLAIMERVLSMRQS